MNYCVNTCMYARKSSEACEECPRPSIYDDNVQAFELFMDCHTQFNYTYGTPTGLRFEALDFAMRCQQIQPSPDLFERIKILELHYLELARNAKKNRNRDSHNR